MSLALLALIGLPPFQRASAEIFFHYPVTEARLRALAAAQRLAPLEPTLGCYIGAFIAREDVLRLVQADGRDTRSARDFETIVGKRHAVYFNYVNLERTQFPVQEARRLASTNAAIHIALEPSSLTDLPTGTDSPLRNFAKAAAESRVPVFVRFASEMNGPWTWREWGGSYRDGKAGDYVRAFRTVATVCHEEVQKYRRTHARPDGSLPPNNVAMVWSPSPYGTNYSPYYPGKEYVDWVGINFYSVLNRNDGTGRPSEFENPLDVIPYVYDRFAKDHPIMVSEWAATQKSKFSANPRPDFAVNKIGQLYGGAPMRFPRLKCINYFSMNSFKYASSDRKTNNFSLFEPDTGDLDFDKFSRVDSSQEVAYQYSRLIESPYFLRKVQMAGNSDTVLNSTVEYGVLPSNLKVSGTIALSALVRNAGERPEVAWEIAGKTIYRSTTPSDYRVTFDTRTLANGPTNVVLRVGSRQIKRRIIVSN